MYRNFCIVVSIVSVAYGLGYTLVPNLIANLYFDTPDAQVSAMGRYFGLTLLGTGVLLWLLKDVTEVSVRSAVATGLLVTGVVGLVTSVVLVLNDTMQSFGWSAVAIYLVIVLWCFLLRQSQVQAH